MKEGEQKAYQSNESVELLRSPVLLGVEEEAVDLSEKVEAISRGPRLNCEVEGVLEVLSELEEGGRRVESILGCLPSEVGGERQELTEASANGAIRHQFHAVLHVDEFEELVEADETVVDEGGDEVAAVVAAH